MDGSEIRDLEIQRSRNWPKEEKISDPHVADPPSTPKPVVWGFDLMTGREFRAYAALRHRILRRKGVTIDEGWMIAWYDNEEEAANADSKARKEAESYITARKLEAEVAAKATPCDLPVQIPAKFAPFEPGVSCVLMKLGFKAEQIKIKTEEGPDRETVRHTNRQYLKSRFVTVAESYDTRVNWYSRIDDVIEIFSNTPINYLIGDDRSDWSIAHQLRVDKEKISEVRGWYADEKKRAEDNYRTTVRQFVEKLKKREAFNHLPSDMQAKLSTYADSYDIPDLSKIVDELKKEWAKAEVLDLEGYLSNFGGHFRVLSRTRQAQYWVIQPDGSERHPDKTKFFKMHSSEGDKWWRLVGPRELAISWFKACSAEPHEFVVNHLPAGGPSPEQLKLVSELEEKISKEWEDAYGMSSGKPSPSIGKGWGLGK